MEQHDAPTQPRGRGRPRASCAHTSEFDLSLIREYRGHPALYNRSSMHYKDKVFAAKQWQVISHNLGYDVSLLRDRMLQLRNRYNIEKRRLENLKAEFPLANMRSQWPLYDNLNFLSEHIRSRRSFKFIGKSSDGGVHDLEEQSFDHDELLSNSNGPGQTTDVKMELSSELDEEEDDADAESVLPVTTVLSIPQHVGTHHNQQHQPKPPHGVIEQNGRNGRSSLTDSVSSQRPNMHRIIVAAPKHQLLPRINEPPVKRKALCSLTKSTDTYRAFGEFVGTSLHDLPQTVALPLVEKFTSDLVQALLRVGQPKKRPVYKKDQSSSVEDEEDN